ncbi:hypothetical protein JQN72_12030 [Phycicoccus sp. CSK15P-2]|uniref:hypothetical protein n=1 Tax=Phycicoccus sp. CSK15P-2 TaxID=2807627 RepID=UPI00194FC665|nr:hypothetical protein [Phycicoccus sp. CSK15P-2]MBM6404970.1 hypothetical protein [Phycicoccus sp. CSK15P-2]
MTKTAVEADGLGALLEDYDERNNAAIAAAHKSDDPKVWASADAELVLDGDRFDTRRAKVAKSKEPASTLRHEPGALYAPEFGEYPMFAIGSATVTSSVKDSEPWSSVGVWLRESAAEPWKQAANVATADDLKLPGPNPVGAESVPTPEQRKATLAAATAVLGYLRGEGKASGVTLDKTLKELRAGSSIRDAKGVDHRMSATFANGADDQVSAEGSVRAVRTDDGVLAVVSIRAHDSFSVGGNSRLQWDEPYGTALGQSGQRTLLSRDIGVVVLLAVADSGKARVLASGWDTAR